MRAPGRRTLTSQIQRRKRAGGSEGKPADARAIAAKGTAGCGAGLPHREAIQKAFGRHDLSSISAHVGGAAAEASERLGAEAFAAGDRVAFRSPPDLHTAAHEAAHVVQQRGGVQLNNGVGQSGDVYERHADAVADRVTRGESAEGLLDTMPGSGGDTGVQMIETYGGDWSTETYEPHSSGALRGCDIKLVFEPSDLVESPKISLTQTISMQKGGTPYYMNVDEREERANTDEQGDEGRHIDRLEGRTSPLYGVNNDGSASNTAQFGKRVVDRAAGTVDAENAFLIDQPKLLWSAGREQSQTFETAAVSLEGEQQNTYYGTVAWGVHTDGAGDITLDPVSVVSMGTPTAEFSAAAENWNAQEVGIGGTATATDDLPITTHLTVDPTTLDDRQLEARMRVLCDEILRMDRASVDYQNKRFEIRGLAREAVRRARSAGETMDSGHTLAVGRGDTLWDLAATHLGSGRLWTRIFALNYQELGDPNRIYAGSTLRMPRPYEPPDSR